MTEGAHSRNIGGSWKIRRRIIFSTLLFCAACIVYSMVWQERETIAEVVITNAFLAGGAIIGSYVFGAVWDDRGQRDRPYRDLYGSATGYRDDISPPGGQY